MTESRDDIVSQLVSGAARELTNLLSETYYGAEHSVADDKALTLDTTDPARNAETVKKVCLQMGADVVGICEPDDDWVFEKSTFKGTTNFPRVVVMGTAMDQAQVRAGHRSSHTASRLGYLAMAQLAPMLAHAITRMGYRAVPTGNGEAKSVPMAVTAGLGRVGRHGMLLTDKFGACLRLCKVFTDMPLAVDVLVY